MSLTAFVALRPTGGAALVVSRFGGDTSERHINDQSKLTYSSSALRLEEWLLFVSQPILVGSILSLALGTDPKLATN
jgi:hypothetical protein